MKARETHARHAQTRRLRTGWGRHNGARTHGARQQAGTGGRPGPIVPCRETPTPVAAVTQKASGERKVTDKEPVQNLKELDVLLLAVLYTNDSQA